MLKCNVKIVKLNGSRSNHSFMAVDQCAERGLPLITVNV